MKSKTIDSTDKVTFRVALVMDVECSSEAEAQMLKYLSDIVYGDIKREIVYLNTLVDKLKSSGAYTYGLELEESLKSVLKLCDLVSL